MHDQWFQSKSQKHHCSQTKVDGKYCESKDFLFVFINLNKGPQGAHLTEHAATIGSNVLNFVYM